ncbi:MAG TPA: rhomboid family intramembrane serine protease [Candidatus Angelobacter sp.]
MNLIAATLGVASLSSGFVYRLLHTYFPSLSAVERTLVVSVVLAALVSLGVSLCWSTTTAKWVWALPATCLIFRMVIFGLNFGGSVIIGHPSVWTHFFHPEFSGQSAIMDYVDFEVFTLAAVRTTTYSFVAWAAARWIRPIPDRSVPATNVAKSEPMVPVIWPDARLPWLSATNVLIVVNIVVFAAMTVSGVSPILPRNWQMTQWGGNLGSLTLGGEYWRLITHSFLHFGIFHLAPNMLFLWWLGRLAERLFGPVILTSIYLLAAVAGGLLHAVWRPTVVAAGASGAFFGIAGALISVVLFGKLKLSSNHLFYRRMTVFIFFNLISAVSAGVDNMAHLGGLAAGLLVGLAIVHSIRSASLHQRFSTVLFFQGRQAIESYSYDSAIQYLQSYLGIRPKDADGHALLGCSLHAREHYSEAIQEYRLALTLGYNDSHKVIEANLAAIQANAMAG